MANATISITGTEEIVAKLEKAGASIHNLPDAFRDMGETFAKYYAGEVFASQGQVYGERWADLSPKTIAAKNRNRDGRMSGASARTVLIATGHMQESFHTEGGDDWMRVYNDATSERGYNYFKAHQLGLGNNPRRMMIGLNATLKNKARDSVMGAIRRRLG